MKKDYFKFLGWAVVSFIPRETQDDKKDKLNIAGLFENAIIAKDSFIPNLPNKEIKRYIVSVDDLERFEEFYNYVNDLKEDYADYWMDRMDESIFSKQEQNKYKYILGL